MSVEACMVCGKPVETQRPGLPKSAALCDLVCIKEWCRQTGTEFLTMNEYAERNRKPSKPSAN